jgi:diaminohydroxyphosphoribosylaminopyrimidine deaminase/5-amino-6-(5-phosphoribosylamino)uracil reductase
VAGQKARTAIDERFMRRALSLAERGRGTTRPNPMVGCVIVRGGKVIAEGWHERPGEDHGELAALRKLGFKARGATVYVTLEPCDHTGRTGPCSRALISAGVRRVVYAMRDPNPQVDGRGDRRLRKAGIAVTSGLLADEAAELNRAFVKWVTTGRPWVTLKAAISLDGRIATRSGDSKWITGEKARREAHRLRAQHDAILVGAGTIHADDPQLTVRGVRGTDPRRVILDGRLGVAATARAVPGALVVTRAVGGDALVAAGAEVVVLPGRDGRVDLEALLDELGRRELTSVLVEGGGEVHGAFLRAGLVDAVELFVAPKIIGGDGVSLFAAPGAATMTDTWSVQVEATQHLGDDLWIRGRLRA